jgi:hypothetical protein
MKRFLLTIIFAAVVSSVAAQTPTEHVRADIMRFRDAEVRVTPGVVRRNEAIISVPFSYIRTGVLRSDIRDSLFGLVQGTVGSPAYWAGQYGPYDVWCIFPRNDGRDDTRPYCLAKSQSVEWATVLNPNNPRFFVTLAYDSMGPRVSPIEIEERDVEVEPDLRLEYRFREWDRDDLDLTVYSARRLAYVFSVPRNPDGSADLDTLAGRVHLTPGPEGRGAIIEFTSLADTARSPQ